MSWPATWQADWYAEWFGPGAASANTGLIVPPAAILAGMGTAGTVAQSGGGAKRRRRRPRYQPTSPPTLAPRPSRGTGDLLLAPAILAAHGTATPWHLTPAGLEEEELLLLLVA